MCNWAGLVFLVKVFGYNELQVQFNLMIRCERERELEKDHAIVMVWFTLTSLPRIKSKIQHDLTCLLKSDMNGFTYQIRAIITEIFVYELRLHVYS